MQIDVIETPGLGDRSYLVSDAGTGVVIDPQRDTDRVTAVAVERGVTLTSVLETHLHNDYVSGGLELSRSTGASYVVPAGDTVCYDHVPAVDGDVLVVGDLRLRVMHTPGHTHHHVSYVLGDATGGVQAVFTGGSLLFGATGRPDLVGAEHTEDLARAQFRSVRRLAELPAHTVVHPGHGFGSFCAATPTNGTASTIGEQRSTNPALTRDEQTFVAEVLAGLGPYPAYYAHMGPINAVGPDPVDLSAPRTMGTTELTARLAAGEWVVDLRSRRAFAAGHLHGALNIELGDQFVTHLGWLHDRGAPLTLVGDSMRQVLAARRELVRIGVDRLAGAAVGSPRDLDPGRAPVTHPVTDFAGLAAQLTAHPDTVVLDTRRTDERVRGAMPGARHIPIHELAARIAEIPPGAVWIHCASGFRASIAASMLARAGRRPVLVDGDFADPHSGAVAAGLLSDRP